MRPDLIMPIFNARYIVKFLDLIKQKVLRHFKL